MFLLYASGATANMNKITLKYQLTNPSGVAGYSILFANATGLPTWTNGTSGVYETLVYSSSISSVPMISLTSNAQTLKYYNPVFGTATAGAVGLTTNRVYATPLIITRPTEIKGIAHNFRDTGTSGSFRMGIYSGNVGEVGTLSLVSGTEVSQATTTVSTTYNLLFASPVTLQAGVYWLTMATTIAAVVSTYPNNTAWNPLLCNSDINTAYTYMIFASIAGSGTALPSSIATSANWATQSRTNAPINPTLIMA